MITLFLLCIGTLSDVFIVRADWPIVRYKNSTVGVKNDGGIVQVQSTDLLVDGNLNVSGKMFVQNRDVAEYEDRVSFLETTLGVNSTSNANCTESYRTRKYPKTATNWDYLSLPSEFYSWSVDFPKSTGTDPILSWDQINRLCLNKGMKLCKSVDLCPNNEPAPGLNIWGTELSTSNDHWIAVGDESNEWYSFNNPKCTKHSIHSGSKPTWGTGTVNYNVMSRAGLCCSELASQPTSLTHWIDFSTHYMESLYGLTSTLNVLTFADNMGNAKNIKVNGNVKYTTNAQNGLGAVYMNAEQTGLEFTSSKLGSNPEVVVVYRIVSKTVSGLLLSSRLNGYHFGTYKTKDGYVGCSATNGRLIVEQEASYDEWHVANLYFGNNDAFLIVDGDESKKNTFGIAGRYGTSSLTNVLIGFYPSTDHYVNAYVGEVMYFNSKLSNSDRSMVTSYLMSKWGISSSGNTTCTESSIGESVSVISELQSLKPPKCIPPGGDKLQFDGTNWICICYALYSGPTCEIKVKPIPLTDDTIDNANDLCLNESPIDGICQNYAAISGFGIMPDWNTSLVTNIYNLFASRYNFNGNISKWDTSRVTNMLGAFHGSTNFNQDLNNWDTSQVTDMYQMFDCQTPTRLCKFNGNISKWDTSQVTNMESMFAYSSFNQYIGDWDTSSLTRYDSIFFSATAFQAKYTCASSTATTVKPSECTTIRSTWIAPPPPPADPPGSVTINGKEL